MPKNYLQTLYDEDYREKAFYIWYSNGRPGYIELTELLPASPSGSKPGAPHISKWKNDYGWEQRADLLDAAASTEADRTMIDARVKMLEEHAKIGKKLYEFGMSFLESKTGGIGTGAEAIRAVVEGISIERDNLGLADRYLKLMSMSETELDKRLKLLMAGQDDNIIDADATELTEDASEETFPE